MSNSVAQKVLNPIFRCLVAFTEFAFPDPTTKEKHSPATKSNVIEIEMVETIKVLKNGEKVRWPLCDHDDEEEVCFMCDCGWTSSVFTLFKSFPSYRAVKETLPDEERFSLVNRSYVVSITNKVGTVCPCCHKHITVVLDTSPKYVL